MSYPEMLANQTSSRVTLTVLLLIGGLGRVARAQESSGAPTGASTPEVFVVSQAALQAAMGAERALSYDASATTNAARYFAGVVSRLARDAQAVDPHGPPLLLRYDDWFNAYLNLSGLNAGEVPLHVKLAYDHRQDVLIDYAVDRVVKSVRDGEWPELAVSVQVGWPESPDLPSQFSYEDTLSKPKLQVTNHRLIKQRLLYFGDLIVYDQVSGITGRPTTGLLSILFKVIGEGRVDWTRMVVADNGIQVARGGASKGPFSVTETFFVRPDGTGEKGLPAKTPEWLALDARLKQVPHIEYHAWTLPDFDSNR